MGGPNNALKAYMKRPDRIRSVLEYYLGEARAWGVRFLLGIENQQTINLTYPWWLMEMDCPGIGVDNSLLMKTILIYESTHHGNSKTGGCGEAIWNPDSDGGRSRRNGFDRL